MAKVLLPKLWASTIPSIWTCGRPNSGQGAIRYNPRNPCCAVSPKSEQIIFQGRFGDLIFVSKQSWRKFRAIQPGHWICTIWSPYVGDMASARQSSKQEIWMRLILWKPSSLLSQGRSRARQGGARPKAPQGHKYNPLGTQEGVIDPSIHQKVTKTKEKHRRKTTAVASPWSCLGDGLSLSHSWAMAEFRSLLRSSMVCTRWRWSKHIYYVSKVLHVIRSFSDSIPPFMILLSLGYASSSIYSR
jgi:hypothetical protein